MFTGLIAHTGTVERMDRQDPGAAISVRIPSLTGAVPGDSIAVNGACLTLTAAAQDRYTFDVSSETMEKTAFGQVKIGDIVNIEMPRQVSDRLHGHIVNGHIDGSARMTGVRQSGKYHIVTFELSVKTPYLVEKGFIAVDGISVTPYDVRDQRIFTIAVIPYTYEHTNLKTRKPGAEVNIEFDIIAKYVESMLKRDKVVPMTEAFLKERGFA